jgi:hypothetical protein
MRVIRVGQLDRNLAGSYAVVTGPVWALDAFNWLEKVIGMEQFLVLISSAPGELERELVSAAEEGNDPIQVAETLLDTIDSDPHRLLPILGDFQVLLRFADSHLSSLQIHRQDPDISCVHSLLAQQAARLHTPLYYAGDLGHPDKNCHFFADFPGYEIWQRLPPRWKRVAR